MEPNQEKLLAVEDSGGRGRRPAVLRTICVFCGSRTGNRPSFSAAALDLGKQLVMSRDRSARTSNALADGCPMIYEHACPAGAFGVFTVFYTVSYFVYHKRTHRPLMIDRCLCIYACTPQVARQLDLVYGGGSGGLMGLVSKTVHDGGRHVLGYVRIVSIARGIVSDIDLVEPSTYDCSRSVHVSGETLGEVKVVRDMHERKSEMAKHADAFVALPGGYGTIEELLEIIAWAQLGIHNKPVGLLNVDGYYNSLLSLFDKGVEEGFIDAAARNIFVLADTAADLLTRLTAATAVVDDDEGGEQDDGAAAAGAKAKRS
ncbi:hypothetical protein GUJ93_ZPchr0013g34477 [Zizania palustris]|uniref:cytokinin riboside 5'-monophosphate phosphoribohydrolase n=1 Tax=Zizania palustris TaxID=103762 RepID=A0A8J5WVF9_ZIZPA|nr:hypothetical protein GUJ93_ZPchr0013g34477 [Zizania palustris]